MEEMESDVHKVVQSYFDCDWEQFEDDAKIQEIIAEMKSLADMYLKTKSSKAGDTMTASIAMEAELKRLKGNLLQRITQLKIEAEKTPTTTSVSKVQESEDVSIEETKDESLSAQEQVVTPSRASSSKLPLILSVFALLLGAGAFYWAFEMSASKTDLENIRQTTVDAVMKNVNATVEGSKADIEGMKGEIQLLKQELEATKLEVAVAKQEATDKVQALKNEFDLRIAALQSSMKKPSKPAPAPAKKSSATKPATKPKPRR